MGELLSVKNINVYYGSIHAIKDVSFHVDEGEIVTLIGANGAGKTTTMHAISGLLKLASGEITYDGNLISKMEAHKIVRLGLAQVPEGRRVFSGLTVQQNLSMGAYTRHDGKDAIQSDYDMVFDLLPRLKERRNQPAGTLSGGEQQMLAVGRALMCKPKILLLDEPSMGLSPLLVKEIFKIIRDINRQGVTVLLVEQNAKMALDIANRAYVLETGTIKMEGEATELANNIEVHKAAQNHADIEKDGDRYRVTCTIQDKNQQHGAFTLQVTMPDAMTAEQVRDHFVACGSEIYNKVLNLLTQPLSDEQRPPEGVR